MTDEQIIEDLQACIDGDCQECSQTTLHFKHCQYPLIKNALDLINRQKAEIEELTELVDKRFDDFASEYDYNLKSEAIKEFAEFVKNAICENTYPSFDKDGKPVSVWNADGYKVIDDLVKEMTESEGE